MFRTIVSIFSLAFLVLWVKALISGWGIYYVVTFLVLSLACDYIYFFRDKEPKPECDDQLNNKHTKEGEKE